MRDDERTRKTVLTKNIPDPETEPNQRQLLRRLEFSHPSRSYPEVGGQRERESLRKDCRRQREPNCQTKGEKMTWKKKSYPKTTEKEKKKKPLN